MKRYEVMVRYTVNALTKKEARKDVRDFLDGKKGIACRQIIVDVKEASKT